MNCSPYLFQPTQSGLQRILTDVTGTDDSKLGARYYGAIRELLDNKNYPCMPARRSFEHGEFLVGIYDTELGAGELSKQVLQDILFFRERQKATSSIYMSHWAIFTKRQDFSEEEFEQRMWRELSAVTAQQDPATPWDPHFSSDPLQKNFCPSFGGDAFFLVGMHGNSSRGARRFPYPSIIFNLYDQFEELSRRGVYEATVKTNRTRELKSYGSLNPMVEKYGDKWEAIQFSGKNNPPHWQCPFQHGTKQLGRT